MKKFIALVICFIVTITFGYCQYQTLKIPYHLIASDKTKPIYQIDTTKDVIYANRYMKSVVVKRGFGTDKDGQAYTKIELADGHIEIFSSLHNYTIANDIIGSEYEYVIKDPIITMHTKTSINANVDIAFLWVNSYNPIGGGGYYFAKIYSYSTNKTYRIKIDDYLYNRYRGQGVCSKQWVKKRNKMMTYDDFQHLLKTPYCDVADFNYNFVEVN